VRRLYGALTSTDSEKVKVLFDQWSLQFSEICGYEHGSSRLDVAGLARNFGVRQRQPDAFRLFFAIHTYYATFIKLLAVQIASFYAFPKLGTGLQQVANYDSTRLREYLDKMERGGVFRDFGINNFLEGDFFGWYLDMWDEELDHALREIVKHLANYSLVTLDVDPDATKDLLKRLYQNLMPKKLRHDLGEYYTPDWLAERLLNQLGYTPEMRDLPRKRILDPACGSGTFLVLAMKRLRQWASEQEAPVDEADLLEQILSNVVGFDLNPLAVTSARTNYLLALGDLLQHRRGEIDIPVYLADSIVTPSATADEGGQMSLEAGTALSFRTAVGNFAVPAALVSAQYIDQLANLLEESVEAGLERRQFRKRLVAAFPLDETNDRRDVEIAEELYGRLLMLQQQGINGIWARIIKNAFAPLFCGQFDFVAGNPPWVNWRNLPDQYRQTLIPLNEGTYGLFLASGNDARHGAAMIDVSTLMFYVSTDRYLTVGGKLGFVITGTVFKSEASRGFRQFSIKPTQTPLRVLHVDDMSSLRPFEGAQNRTAVLIVEKGRPTRYPVSYTYWRKSGPRATLRTDDPIAYVSEHTRRARWQAVPIDGEDATSPWLTGRLRSASAVRRAVGSSNRQAKLGTHTWANGVFWVHLLGRRPDGLAVVANIAQSSRARVPAVQGAVEADLVYPLLRGRDVGAWCASPMEWILVTHSPDRPSKAIPEDQFIASHPKAYAFLSKFEDVLRARSGYQRYFDPESDPFYAMYNIGSYTFARHKLVWREQAAVMTAAVVSTHEDRIVIPDHKLTVSACGTAEEAHYVCACLNNSVTRFLVKSYAMETSISTHVFRYVGIPEFDGDSDVHASLSGLSQKAHQATRAGAAEQLPQMEVEIDRVAAELWGLTDAELKDIQDSLADLRS